MLITIIQSKKMNQQQTEIAVWIPQTGKDV